MSIRKIAMVAALALFAVATTTPAHANPADKDGRAARIPGMPAKKPAAKPAPKAAPKAAPAQGQAAAPAPRAPAAPAVRVGFGYGVQVHAPDGDQRVIDHVQGHGLQLGEAAGRVVPLRGYARASTTSAAWTTW